MNNIAWFKELSKTDIPIVGGKAANLGEMFKILMLFLTGAFCLIWATLLMIYDKK